MTTHPARIAALALAFGLGAFALHAADTVVAVVNGKEIHRKDLEDFQRATPQLRQAPLDAIYDRLLETLIDDQLVTAEARKKKLQDDPEVKAKLKELEGKLIQQAYIGKEIKARVNDQALMQAYNTHAANFKPAEEVHASHILVETEEQANQILADINKGGSFEELAKTKSKDPGSAKEGGDLDWFTKEQMVPEFANVAFTLKPGQVSDKPVKTQFGWHIIKVTDKRMSSLPPFEQVKDQLYNEMAQQTIVGIIQDLRSKADVKRFGLDGKPLVAKPAAAPAAGGVNMAPPGGVNMSPAPAQ